MIQECQVKHNTVKTYSAQSYKDIQKDNNKERKKNDMIWKDGILSHFFAL